MIIWLLDIWAVWLILPIYNSFAGGSALKYQAQLYKDSILWLVRVGIWSWGRENILVFTRYVFCEDLDFRLSSVGQFKRVIEVFLSKKLALYLLFIGGNSLDILPDLYVPKSVFVLLRATSWSFSYGGISGAAGCFEGEHRTIDSHRIIKSKPGVASERGSPRAGLFHSLTNCILSYDKILLEGVFS